MPTQSDFPDRWACTSDSKETKVEIRNPNGEDVANDLQLGVSRFANGDALVTVRREGGPGPALSELNVNVYDFETDDLLWSLSLHHFTYNADQLRYETRVDSSNLDTENDATLYASSDVATSFAWIEIPTMEVELWEEKGDAASIQRTAKVKFPTEWGETPTGGSHNSPRELVEGFSPDDSQPFMFGRVKFKDENGIWVVKHLGWVGGIGSAEGNNRSKLWIYDFAEFLSGVPVGETFHNLAVGRAVEKISQLVVENTGIPLSGVAVMAPETEEEFKNFGEGAIETGDIKGSSSEIGSQTTYYSLKGVEEDFTVGNSDLYKLNDGLGIPNQSDFAFTAAIIDTKDEKFIPFEPDAKHFTANENTLLDVFTWFEEKTQAKMHFEPTATGRGLLLVADIVPSRRTFADRQVISKRFQEDDPISFHEPTTVLKNTALYEMKPQNTVNLRGSYPDGIVDDVWDGFVNLGGEIRGALGILGDDDGGPPPEEYPVVKVQAPALVEAANGVEVSGEVIESDAKTLEDARKEAIRKLSKTLGETSEGEIVMYGKSRLTPYDEVISYEVCNGQVQYEQDPVRYEAQSVKHVASANEPYKTRITVSIFANDTNIDVVREEMVTVKK